MERENQRILAILEDSDSDKDLLDDGEEVEEEDHVSVRSKPSDTEHECSDDSSICSDDDIPLSE